MALKFDIKQETFEYLKSQQGLLESTGMTAFSDYDAWFAALDSIEKVDITLAMINNLENLDPMINPIKETTTEVQVVEEYIRAKFNDGALDVAGKSYKPTLQNLTLPSTEYSCGVEISQVMALKDERGTIDKVIGAVAPAYQRKLRAIAMKALLTLPTSESKNAPCFWRDSSAFTDPENRLVPHQNGLIKFTAAESHYLAEATYDKDMIQKLTSKIRSKGYGENGVVIVASEATWKKYREAYTYEELRTMELITITPDFAPAINKETYVTMSDSVFPEDYFLAYDPTEIILKHKISDNPKTQGLMRMFDTFATVRTANRADFKVIENGMGVVAKGAGAVMYVGGTTYVNPDLSAI